MDSDDTILVLNALGQKTRFDVVCLLLKHEPKGLSSGDVARALDVPPNTMSTHLSKLSQAGLIQGERQSRYVIYHADRKRLAVSLASFLDFCQPTKKSGGR
jgi:ArsR family transcriptional regulator